MNKQIKKVLLSLLAAGCALSVAACAKTKTLTKEEAEAQLDGFTLPDNITQEVLSFREQASRQTEQPPHR